MTVMRRVGAAALALALLGGLSACGDDDGGGDEESQEDSSGSGSGSGVDESEDEGSDDGGSSGGDLSDEDCAELLASASAFANAFTGEDSNFGDVAEAFDEMGDRVEGEVGDALRVLGDAYREFADAVGDIDFNDAESFTDPEVQEALEEASAIFEEPEVVEAGEVLSDFGENACGGALSEE
jgi:hypothetical protein